MQQITRKSWVYLLSIALFTILLASSPFLTTRVGAQAVTGTPAPTLQSGAITPAGQPVDPTLLAILAVVILAGVLTFVFRARKRVSGKK